MNKSSALVVSEQITRPDEGMSWMDDPRALFSEMSIVPKKDDTKAQKTNKITRLAILLTAIYSATKRTTVPVILLLIAMVVLSLLRDEMGSSSKKIEPPVAPIKPRPDDPNDGKKDNSADSRKKETKEIDVDNPYGNPLPYGPDDVGKELAFYPEDDTYERMFHPDFIGRSPDRFYTAPYRSPEEASGIAPDGYNDATSMTSAVSTSYPWKEDQYMFRAQHSNRYSGEEHVFRDEDFDPWTLGAAGILSDKVEGAYKSPVQSFGSGAFGVKGGFGGGSSSGDG